MKRWSIVLSSFASFVLFASFACAPPEGGPDEAELEPAGHPIVGGTRALPCQWPTAVGLDGCTGTLVHPRIVTTAAHCVPEGESPTEATFGETWSGAGVVRKVPIERCVSAEGSGVEGDFGFCVLAQPVEDVPIVPVIYGCEIEALKAPGARAVLAGYGRRGGFSFSSGVKFHVGVDIGAISGNDIRVGNSRQGGCQGDSGGPAFIELPDQTWRVFGATSRGALFCNSQTIYTLIHPFVAWLEQDTGIDITPCHDRDGAWNPGPGCTGFPLDPWSVGSWANACGHQRRAGPGASCDPARAEE